MLSEPHRIITGDALDTLRTLPDNYIDCCITSPPYYGLRDYGVDGQIGLEQTPEQYIQRLVDVFREVRRVLRDDGTLWINIADSYGSSGKGAWRNKTAQKETYTPDPGTRITKMPKTFEDIKSKDLIGIPWLLAFALRADGWYLRQDIIWHKPNPMPESVTDRCTRCHEYIFLLSKSPRYYYDTDAVAEPCAQSTINRCAGKTNGPTRPDAPRFGGNKYTASPEQFYRTKSGNCYVPKPMRNKRDVWTVATRGFKGAHFATFPEQLIEPCILAGSRQGGVVLDPFCGSGTTGVVALRHGRQYLGIDLNPEYTEMAKNRIDTRKKG